MKVIVLKSEREVIKESGKIITGAVRKNPFLVLGLATGKTMIPLYRELVKLYMEGKVNFSKVKTFNLDEYVGLSPDDKKSYRYYMEKHFFSKVNLKKENINFLNGAASDLSLECRNYEKKIRRAGGIDFQVLGIGRNAHVGFNEPGSGRDSRTRKIKLSKTTKEVNYKPFKSIEKMPKQALTMGVGTILESKKIILLATGRYKAEAVADALTKRVSSRVPASFLRTHQDSTFIVDKNASSGLKESSRKNSDSKS